MVLCVFIGAENLLHRPLVLVEVRQATGVVGELTPHPAHQVCVASLTRSDLVISSLITDRGHARHCQACPDKTNNLQL